MGTSVRPGRSSSCGPGSAPCSAGAADARDAAGKWFGGSPRISRTSARSARRHGCSTWGGGRATCIGRRILPCGSGSPRCTTSAKRAATASDEGRCGRRERACRRIDSPARLNKVSSSCPDRVDLLCSRRNGRKRWLFPRGRTVRQTLGRGLLRDRLAVPLPAMRREHEAGGRPGRIVPTFEENRPPFGVGEDGRSIQHASEFGNHLSTGRDHPDLRRLHGVWPSDPTSKRQDDRRVGSESPRA